MIKNKVLWFVVFMLGLFMTDDLMAQRRRTTSRRSNTSERRSSSRYRDDKGVLDDQWLAIHLGNFTFGTIINLATKFSYGIELEDRVSFGANGKLYFFRNSNLGQGYFDYGFAGFTRIKIIPELYVIGEYGMLSLDQNSGRNTEFYPSAGLGYQQITGRDWNFGLHIQYPFNRAVESQYGLEYWIDFNYKF